MTVEIRVPASSANLGPGFDCLGLALPFFLTVHASPSEKWKITNQTEHLPVGLQPQDHLLVRTALWTAEKYGQSLPPCDVELSSEIPLARGLGSSAAAIVGGIQLANEMANLKLSCEEIVHLASELEGHPDNVAAAVYGEVVVAIDLGSRTEVMKLHAADFYWLVAIPNNELKTSVARGVLPDTYQRDTAVKSSAVANMLVAALSIGDAEKVGFYMEQDNFHEPYRFSLIEHAEAFRRDVKRLGAFGTSISGAGPTLLSLVPAEFPIEQLSSLYPHLSLSIVTTWGAGLETKQIAK
ncbi:homoserine kinase [Chryseomicrobium palamuruense]|uniref:Homoserine kinase n=1 Tax=Chryseomicrobium palamuruense TaxID=682973 RepID=A0ABV8UVQ2_9BACL